MSIAQLQIRADAPGALPVAASRQSQTAARRRLLVGRHPGGTAPVRSAQFQPAQSPGSVWYDLAGALIRDVGLSAALPAGRPLQA
jgi:hypothetical protein